MELELNGRETQGEEEKRTIGRGKLWTFSRDGFGGVNAFLRMFQLGAFFFRASCKTGEGSERRAQGDREEVGQELEGRYRVLLCWVDIRLASAALFDPKGDDRTMADTRKPWESTGGKWVEVIKNEEARTEREVVRLINAIRVQRWAQFYLRLHRIIGPDGEFYGYLYTAWGSAVITPKTGTFSVLVPDTPPTTNRLVP